MTYIYIDIQTVSGVASFITIDEHLQLNRSCYFPHADKVHAPPNVKSWIRHCAVLPEGFLFSRLFPLLNVIQ